MSQFLPEIEVMFIAGLTLCSQGRGSRSQPDNIPTGYRRVLPPAPRFQAVFLCSSVDAIDREGEMPDVGARCSRAC